MSHPLREAWSGNVQPFQQVRHLSLDAFIQLSNQIDWDILSNDTDAIEIGDLILQYSPYHVAFVSQFNPPIHDIILYLPSTRYDEYPPDRMVYHSDRGFTPLDILGAIYTYYQIPVPRNVLEQMVQDGVANAQEALNTATSRRSTEGRISIMGDLTRFESLTRMGDGYHVDLGS